MSIDRFFIRPYSNKKDFQRLVKLHREADKRNKTENRHNSRSLHEELNYPGMDPGKNLFIAETPAGAIAGYAVLKPEPAINRVIINGLVHPDHRRMGAASLLLQACLHRAAMLNITVSHVNISCDNRAAKQFLLSRGFCPVRRFLELRTFLPEKKLHSQSLARLSFRPLRRHETALLTELQNRCFLDTWGFNPNREEEISYLLGLPGASAADVVLAVENQNAVAYCWTRVTGRKKRGRILMLGVAPEHRGRGIGRGILYAGLNHLRSRQVTVVELTADQMNKVSCSLYFSSGFKVWKETEWLEKNNS